MTFDEVMSRTPWIAIVRGVRPEEAVEIAAALADGGLLAVEVPLNSPEPLVSIRRIKDALGDRLMVGAGTVLTAAQAGEVAEAGGVFVVSPNADARVISETKRLGMLSLPGVFTPTEAFLAIEAGADALKIFPAEASSPAAMKAMLAVLPKGTRMLPVGGVGASNFKPWVEAGAAGFGVGGALYRPGDSAGVVRSRASELAKVWSEHVSA